jgi:hypothetical protein
MVVISYAPDAEACATSLNYDQWEVNRPSQAVVKRNTDLWHEVLGKADRERLCEDAQPVDKLLHNADSSPPQGDSRSENTPPACEAIRWLE